MLGIDIPSPSKSMCFSISNAFKKLTFAYFADLRSAELGKASQSVILQDAELGDMSMDAIGAGALVLPSEGKSVVHEAKR